MGYPYGIFCTIQSVLINTGTKGSWFGVVLISYQLRLILTTGKLGFTLNQAIIFYIIFQIIAITIPYLTNIKYGNAEELQGKQICFSYSTKENYVNDEIINFMLYCWCMILYLIYDTIIIFKHVKKLKEQINVTITELRYKKTNELKWSALMYPVFMILVWTPVSIESLYYLIIDNGKETTRQGASLNFSNLIAIWSTLDGFFNGCVYFINGTEARRNWYNLLLKYKLGRIYLFLYQFLCFGNITDTTHTTYTTTTVNKNDYERNMNVNLNIDVDVDVDVDTDTDTSDRDQEQEQEQDFPDDSIISSLGTPRKAISNSNLDETLIKNENETETFSAIHGP